MLRSSREAHLVGDIVSEIEHAEAFLEGVTADGLRGDLKTLYAVEKALQNVAEACIQLNGKRGDERFSALFPDHSFEDIRTLGNLIRHDYGALDPGRVWTEVKELLPSLRAHAAELLDAHRRAFGHADPNADEQ